MQRLELSVTCSFLLFDDFAPADPTGQEKGEESRIKKRCREGSRREEERREENESLCQVRHPLSAGSKLE